MMRPDRLVHGNRRAASLGQGVEKTRWNQSAIFLSSWRLHGTLFHDDDGCGILRLHALCSAGRHPNLASRPYGFRRALQHLYRRFPIDTSISNALTVHQWLSGDEILTAADQVTFDHHPADPLIAARNLTADIFDNQRLASVVLVAVGVAGVDHDARLQTRLDHVLAGRLDTGSIVI